MQNHYSSRLTFDLLGQHIFARSTAYHTHTHTHKAHLSQRRLVHAVNHGELGDKEVDQRSTVRHWSVLLASFVNLLVGLARVCQLLRHVLCVCACVCVCVRVCVLVCVST